MGRERKDFHTMDSGEVLSYFETSFEGLFDNQVKENREKYGENILCEEKRKNPVQVFLSQFADLLVIILIIAAVISMFTGNGESAVVILCVIMMNSVLGTLQHFKAQKSLDSLKAMSAPNAKVMRNGVICEVPASEVVAGDIALLEAGNICPGDGRILEASALLVNESALTGESVNVMKTPEKIEDVKAPLGDRTDMVYSGTAIENGRGMAVVTAVGVDTEMGKIADMMSSAKRRKTPLQESLDKFSRGLTICIIMICILVMALSIFIQGNSVMDALMFAVALAVAAIPEALSSIITISLAAGTRKMAKQNAIIKDLKAVEGLGCVSVICSDKTGTLTMNQMTVCDTMTIGGQKKELSDAMALCNDSCVSSEGNLLGDPTETALLSYVGQSEYERLRAKYPRIGEIPFDSDRKLMSTVNRREKDCVMYTKGAFDVLLPKLVSYVCDETGNTHEMTAEVKEQLIKANEEYSENGMRVLAFAKKIVDNAEVSTDEEENYIFIGLAAMTDPPRKESCEAVGECIQAGIKPVMITGDHALTAKAIARQIGIFREGDLCVEGTELDNMSEEELFEKIEQISVYARVSPANKIRIVETWQKKGQIVAMTGDGVNDAPALKKADVGIAMGITGTEVSKDAASMVLADDNFATIIRAVAGGRNIYGNIKNAVKFLIAGNTAAVLTVLFAALFDFPAPFTAVHLLFINLLTDSLPAIALCSEPMKKGVLKEKPRSMEDSIIDKKAARYIALHSVLLTFCVVSAYFVGYTKGAETAATMAFATLCLGRLFEGLNSRSDRSLAAIGFMTNSFSLVAFGLGALLLSAALFVAPLHGFMNTCAMPPINYLLILLFAAIPFLVFQSSRMFRERRVKERR